MKKALKLILLLAIITLIAYLPTLLAPPKTALRNVAPPVTVATPPAIFVPGERLINPNIIIAPPTPVEIRGTATPVLMISEPVFICPEGVTCDYPERGD